MVIFSSEDISLMLSLVDEVLCAGCSSSGLGDFQLYFSVHGALVAQTQNNVRPLGFSTYLPRLLVQNFSARLAVYWVKYSKEVN